MGEQIGTVVKGYVARDIKELLLLIGRGDYSTAKSTDVIALLGDAGKHVARDLVGAAMSARHPNNNKIDLLVEDGLNDGVVQGLDMMA